MIKRFTVKKHGWEILHVKLSAKYLEETRLPGQAIPLIRNGCANTQFNLHSLDAIL
jgi:hypothetical protein